METFARSLVITVLGTALLAGGASAQTSTVYFSEPVQVGARALAFSRAVTGDNPDVTVIYGNPAALSFLDNSAIVLTHTLERTTAVMDENIAVPLFLRRGEVVGIAASLNHVGHLRPTTRSPFEVIQYGYDVAYSRTITPVLSIGGALNVRYARSAASRLWGLSSSLGVFYYPSPDVSYGIAVTGLGSGMKYIYDGTTTLLNSENMPRKLYAGSVLRYPSRVGRMPFLQISLAAEKNFDIKGIYYFGGVEALPLHFLAIRAGYLGGPGNLEYASMGIGFRAAGWKLDVGMTPAKRSGEFYQVSISAPIWNQLEAIF